MERAEPHYMKDSMEEFESKGNTDPDPRLKDPKKKAYDDEREEATRQEETANENRKLFQEIKEISSTLSSIESILGDKIFGVLGKQEGQLKLISNILKKNLGEGEKDDIDFEAINKFINKFEDMQRAGRIDAPSPGSKKEVSRLRARDREVRAHELAHALAGGKYQFETGPDGKKYAVGGSVSLRGDALEPIPGDPSKTYIKAKIVHDAALAPKNPSSVDMSIATEARN